MQRQCYWPPYFGKVIIPQLNDVDSRVMNSREAPATALERAQATAKAQYAELFKK